MSTGAISSVASTPQTQQPSTTAAGYSRTSSLDLTLTTRDGDTVTISAQQTTTAGVSRTQGLHGRHHGHHHQGQESQRSQRGRGGLATIASISGSFSSSVAVLGGVLYGAPAGGDQTAAPADNASTTADSPVTTDASAAA